jgi:hypothetical protein
VTRGEPRIVHLRQPRCRFLLPRERFARPRYQRELRHLRRLAPPEWSDDRRARVRGPSKGRVPVRQRLFRPSGVGCMRFERACRRRSPSRQTSGRPTVAGATARKVGGPHERNRTGLGSPSAAAPRRVTASCEPGAFHRRDRVLARIAPRMRVIGLSLTPPTPFPLLGDGAFSGLASAAA